MLPFASNRNIHCCSDSNFLYNSRKRMIDHRRKQIEFDYISWIEVGGLDSPRCESLFDYICTAQKEMGIPVQYCVLAKDEENVRLIIKKFQQDISTRFFARKLSLGKPNHKIKAKDMFFYLLFMYLAVYVFRRT